MHSSPSMFDDTNPTKQEELEEATMMKKASHPPCTTPSIETTASTPTTANSCSSSTAGSPAAAAAAIATTTDATATTRNSSIGRNKILRSRPSHVLPSRAKLLKPIQDDLKHFVDSQHGQSFSSLSLCVNDSAGKKTFQECYEASDLLGEGGFALVCRCTHVENKQEYAVKEIINCREYESAYQNSSIIRNEISALKRLRDCPHVVRLFDVFTEYTRSTEDHQLRKQTYLVMEEMKGGDLLSKIAEKVVYNEHDARKMSRTLLEAVDFCHKKQIVHRDIKPENILLVSATDDTKIKLADFGFCTRFTPGNPHCLHTLCGTPEYVAPELYSLTSTTTCDDDDKQIDETATPRCAGYDERCDLWSVGIIIYILLGGYLPFQAKDPNDLPEVIRDGWFEFHEKYWEDVSEPPKNLIRSLLTVNRDNRASIDEALNGEWLQRRDRMLMGESSGNFDVWLLNREEFYGGGMNNNNFATDKMLYGSGNSSSSSTKSSTNSSSDNLFDDVELDEAELLSPLSYHGHGGGKDDVYYGNESNTSLRLSDSCRRFVPSYNDSSCSLNLDDL